MSPLLWIALAVLGICLLEAGYRLGWWLARLDTSEQIVAQRLAAERRIELETRATLQAMRDVLRNQP